MYFFFFYNVLLKKFMVYQFQNIVDFYILGFINQFNFVINNLGVIFLYLLNIYSDKNIFCLDIFFLYNNLGKKYESIINKVKIYIFFFNIF